MELARTTSTFIVTACWLPLCRTSPVFTPITSGRVAKARSPIGSAMQALNTVLTRSRCGLAAGKGWLEASGFNLRGAVQAAARFYCHFVQQEVLSDRMAISECKESIEALSSRRSTQVHYSTRRTYQLTMSYDQPN